eukprot:scaffold8496_cov66-Cyclotella_meneghiniana.AAC.5
MNEKQNKRLREIREDYKHRMRTMTTQQQQELKSKGMNQAQVDAMLSNDLDEGPKRIVTATFSYNSGGSVSDVTISNETARH